MTTLYTQTYSSPVGDIDLASIKGKLCLCNWSGKKNKDSVERRLKKHLDIQQTITANTTVIDQTITQLNAYFEGELTTFDIPLILAGSPFQQRVWQQLVTIPYGQTLSYAELAHQLGQPKAVRAVANANAANALSILIPCHRVIGSNGKLTGYAGGLTAKQHLIQLEQRA